MIQEDGDPHLPGSALNRIVLCINVLYIHHKEYYIEKIMNKFPPFLYRSQNYYRKCKIIRRIVLP